jgi:hypothetical protein
MKLLVVRVKQIRHLPCKNRLIVFGHTEGDGIGLYRTCRPFGHQRHHPGGIRFFSSAKISCSREATPSRHKATLLFCPYNAFFNVKMGGLSFKNHCF